MSTYNAILCLQNLDQINAMLKENQAIPEDQKPKHRLSKTYGIAFQDGWKIQIRIRNDQAIIHLMYNKLPMSVLHAQQLENHYTIKRCGHTFNLNIKDTRTDAAWIILSEQPNGTHVSGTVELPLDRLISMDHERFHDVLTSRLNTPDIKDLSYRIIGHTPDALTIMASGICNR